LEIDKNLGQKSLKIGQNIAVFVFMAAI